MCILCSINRPSDPLVGLDSHEVGSGLGSILDLTGSVSDELLPDPVGIESSGLMSGGGSAGDGAPSAPFTWDQIADQLTDGYWAWSQYAGAGPRSFTLDASRELYFDMSGLSSAEQLIAEAAMDIWGRVAGINFVESAAASFDQFTEFSDVAGSTATSFNITDTSETTGSVGFNGDKDWYRVTLTAGETYTFDLEGSNGLDAYLRLFNGSGFQLAQDDDSGDGLNSQISFTVTSTGTYYLEAGGLGASVGNYLLRSSSGAASGVDITFDNNDDSGAYAAMTTSGSQIIQSNINIPTDWSPLDLNGYMLQTYIHELGHALGLGHAGNYNGGATFGVDNLYDNDSWSATVMSYFDMNDNTFDDATQQYLSTVMPADVIAIQNLYGPVTTANTGSTQWGRNANMGGYLQTQINNWINNVVDGTYYDGNAFAYTIVDSSGNDLIDFSNFGMDQELLLSELSFSNIGGQIDNIAIARGTVIERGTTGAGNDTLSGNGAANTLTANGGDDVAYGGAGNDTIVGGSGNDSLFGGGNNDLVQGNSGDDTLAGAAGADAHDGGTGRDAVSYANATGAVQAELQNAAINSGEALGDTYVSIESMIGSSFNDTLGGNNGITRIDAGNGADSVRGFGGNDQLYGGNDNDTLLGGTGADLLDGDAGTDFASYTSATAAVRADLRNTAGFNTGDAAGDTFTEIEGLMGSAFNDVLYGTTGDNFLYSYGGDDQVFGLGGQDNLTGNSGNDTLYGGSGNDTISGGSGNDFFVFDAGRDVISDFADNLDTIRVEDSLLAAGQQTVQGVLNLASVVAGSIVITFNGSTSLTLTGITNIASLSDDIVLI